MYPINSIRFLLFHNANKGMNWILTRMSEINILQSISQLFIDSVVYKRFMNHKLKQYSRVYTLVKKVIIFSSILNLTDLTEYFNTSAYVAIMWLLFDKTLKVSSKSQTELRSVKYG